MAESFPVLVLNPLPSPGRTEIRREIPLRYTQKVGRAVPGKASPSRANAVFDSKVLSRSHAELWSDNGRVFIKDTKSSNGTYVNDDRLSPGGVESSPRQLKTGDVLKLGVDVLENNTAAHKCVVLEVIVEGGGDLNHRQTIAQALMTPLEVLANKSKEQLLDEIKLLQAVQAEQAALGETVTQKLTEAQQNERRVQAKLKQLSMLLDGLTDAMETQAQDLIDRDRLLGRIDLLEEQLAFYKKRCDNVMESGQDDNNMLNKLSALTQGLTRSKRTSEELLASKTALHEKIAKLNQETVDLQRQLSDKESSMQAKLDSTEERERKLLAQLTSLREELVEALQRPTLDDLEVLNLELESAQASLQEAEDSVAALQEEVRIKEEENSEAQDLVTSLRDQVELLQEDAAKLRPLTAELESTKQEVDRLQTELAEQQQANAGRSTMQADLQAQVESLRTRLEEAETARQRAEQHQQDRSSSATQSDAELTKLQEELAASKSDKEKSDQRQWYALATAAVAIAAWMLSFFDIAQMHRFG
eukprot:TRINITY_DN7849_c0_g1_i4.p1 TRINITY_DN7849_c0_g1~~TRINITY_DN7849_c0_g1_i4.p1  ORF type:complete len:532 (+),score=109.98 TRINITY_DN7849_c0_g1_i4:70-1665(+)